VSTPQTASADEASTPQIAPLEASSAVNAPAVPSVDVPPSVAPSAPRPIPSAELAPSAATRLQNADHAPQLGRQQEVAQAPAAKAPERDAAAPAVETAAAPPVERPSTSKSAQVAGGKKAAAPVPKTTSTKPDATVTARRDSGAAQTQDLALARRRALSAADQALADGRLTSPPDASAYVLYNRVLALDPASPEARRGLQSVREKLINRAMAELAGNALDDARRSLQVAADVGADPALVTNLRTEVDYRQRLIDARAQ